MVEVGLEVRKELQEFLSDFPPAPTKEVIAFDQLGEFQHNVLTQVKVKQVGETKKLVQNFDSKHRYVEHYSTLKLYIRLGLSITKLYRTVQFKKS